MFFCFFLGGGIPWPGLDFCGLVPMSDESRLLHCCSLLAGHDGMFAGVGTDIVCQDREEDWLAEEIDIPLDRRADTNGWIGGS